ncbi:MAG: hypothetical protein PHF86_15025 [Candidatus Nanoarchaeia archaeon]|nr:hypothetical protein [Candidatus Nanoarchaeia archaeon]
MKLNEIKNQKQLIFQVHYQVKFQQDIQSSDMIEHKLRIHIDGGGGLWDFLWRKLKKDLDLQNHAVQIIDQIYETK